ncbi:alkaline/neutral invertase CINV1 [Spinacia oleracea]|uniref:Alkaline/neutral invertase n=1 Tax=Spinacia oleracea TaxID=3562 RepID=A0ABM3RFH2_SPIOL|nr:alkaline/neutral invertase CINV1-like [Spinacia oleracea]XP_056694357.1 alkaline/neutral invertase CINV1-like [Spinacia oleracea]XP_056694358.1 alkaline/neutral invertase CINV1-like [Spinacia oleracea]
MRDVPSVVACLIENTPEANIMKIFLLKILQLQRRRRKKDNFTLGEGLMLVSFKVEIDEKYKSVKELRVADYDCNATGRVVPIDSLFWWPILLQSYEKRTRDYSLVDTPEVQKGMKCICDLCLSDGFDTVPSLLCADPCCMIDKEMSALACLMKETPETYIVEKLSLKTLQLQGCGKNRDNFTLGEGVMPASFKVEVEEKYGRVKEMWVADYDGTTTGRVAPTNSWFCWIILLQSYDNCTSDNSLADTPEMQKSMKWIADLCLSDGFDNFPSLLFADAYCMTDRRKVFVVDFDVVNKILLKTLQFLARGKKINNFILREGVMPLMPTRFMLEIDEKCEHVKEMLVAEYGGTTTGRVAPMDLGFWWIIFLQSYDKHTRDYSLADIPEMHKGMKWMVFTRDIVIVKIFLLKTLHIQGCENIGNFTLGEGVMPASLKVEIDKECQCVKEILVAVCGGTATGTVAPTGFGVLGDYSVAII